MSAEELVGWLQEQFKATLTSPDEVLLGTGKPDAVAVVGLVRQFGQRDAAAREAAVRRLLAYPEMARPSVLKAFRQGKLSERLAALELLREWKAPVDGLDPWRPESFSEKSLAALTKWAEEPMTAPAIAEKLSAEQIAGARESIERMLRASDSEVEAFRERLAWLGAGLLPEIYGRLKEAADDRDRERLQTLRYRLASSDTLVLSWPGGLARLAATDSRERQQAAGELAQRATEQDQALLLELFSDQDPLVREISLRTLRAIGGKRALSALVELLADPEPNIRAAVLKQLEEAPDPRMVGEVAEYLKKEKDPDLIVHALRFLRAAGGADAIQSMMPLLKHESWQVRAEAAAGIGGSEEPFSRYSYSSGGEEDQKAMEARAAAYVALVDVLEDSDAFVVSRAVEGLSKADLDVAVEPLVGAAAKHPDLATEIVGILAQGKKMRAKAIPHLHAFFKHQHASIRAAALTGLAEAEPDGMEKELVAGLQDAQGKVRIAAAEAVFKLLETSREAGEQSLRKDLGGSNITSVPAIAVSRPSIADKVLGILGLRVKPSQAADAPAAEEAKPTSDDAKEDAAPSAADLPQVPTSPPIDPHRGPKLAEPEAKPVVIPGPQIDSLPTDAEITKPLPQAGTADRAEASGGEAESGETDSTGAKPASDEDVSEGQRWDEWLRAYYGGRGRAAWAARVLPLLEKMLRAEQGEERMVAARALVPLGNADQALPVLLQTTGKDPGLWDRAVQVLPWLPWDERKKTFQQLLALANQAEQVSTLFHGMALNQDPRAVELFWELLGDEKLGEHLAGMHSALGHAYLGNQYYSMERDAPTRRIIARDAQTRVGAGSEAQRLVALLLLLGSAPDEAVKVAQPMSEDSKLSEALRRDAFQVLLAAQPSQRQRVRLAIEALGSPDVPRRKLALSCLTGDEGRLSVFRDDIYLRSKENKTCGVRF